MTGRAGIGVDKIAQAATREPPLLNMRQLDAREACALWHQSLCEYARAKMRGTGVNLHVYQIWT